MAMIVSLVLICGHVLDKVKLYFLNYHLHHHHFRLQFPDKNVLLGKKLNNQG